MTDSNNTTDTPLSTIGFNQKFLQTETGRALAHALLVLRAQPGCAPEDPLVKHQEEVTDTIDMKD